ncbi:MAG: succinylglutamate desuccinylase/aspartoacylase family protein [Candidatus Bathyarchaeia archaeon]
MPITVINGVESGPRLAMTAGFHPREYASIEALTRLSNLIDPSAIRGSAVIVHIVNTPGFEVRGRKNPIDDAHPTNSFPGSPDGGISQRIAHTLATEVISGSDYYIDHHCNDVQWVGPRNIIYPTIGNEEVDSKSEAMARCYKIKYLRKSVERGSGSALGYATHEGIPGILTETGSMMGMSSETGLLQEERIDWNIEGTKNVMKLIGMIDGTPYQSTEKPITNVVYLRAKESGILYPLVGADETASKGQAVAEIRDPFGNVKETMVSPIDGVVSLMTSYRAITQGLPIIQLYELP